MIIKNQNFLKIHYKREDDRYENWSLWLWEFSTKNGKEYNFDFVDDFGACLILPLSTWSDAILNDNLGFIIKSKDNWSSKDIKQDRKIIFFNIEEKNGGYEVFLKENDENIYLDSTFAKIMSLNNSFEISKELFPEISDKNIDLRKFYKTNVFNEKYNFDGDLGVILDGNKTIFKVWSPVSKSIKVRIYKSGTPKYLSKKFGNDKILFEFEMAKENNGVFSYVFDKNLEGKYYTYIVSNFMYKEKEIVDPYAKSTGVNGLRGLITDFSKTNPKGFNQIKNKAIKPYNLTVYETHIADLTSSKTWSRNKCDLKIKNTYLGACKSGTFYKENGVTVKTGFDHIKEMGVNAVQLLPVCDQVNDEINPSYNWGYNPLNYQVLEGSYSTNPFDGYSRIKEFKQLVKSYNDFGINIIMDVVFNHVYKAIGSNLDVLMPGYYFRYDELGFLSNGSGCGCETASEMPMFRKLMIDTLLLFVKEYKISGFRFDLMGLHDLETMSKISAILKDFDENIIIYGEPWCGGHSSLDKELCCEKFNISKFNNFGFFNDEIREKLNSWLLKRGNNSEELFSEINRSKNLTVNYASCHDNYTLFDRAKFFRIKDNEIIGKMNQSINSIIFTSKGISFMLSGEEFLRTKSGNGNSYNASYKTNELDYSLKVKNIDIVENYKKLIKFKQTVFDEDTKIKLVHKSSNLIEYELINKTNATYRIIHSNGTVDEKPYSINLLNWELYLDTLNQNQKLSKYTKLKEFETIIAVKKTSD